MAKDSEGNKNGPSMATKIILSVVVFIGSAAIATLLMGPSWMVERRIATGQLNDSDRARMRANPTRYLNMVGEGMQEAVTNGSWEVLESQLEFVLSTLDTIPAEEQRMQAAGLSWQLGAIIGSIEDVDRQLEVLSQVGAGSELRARVQCTAAGGLSNGESVRALLPPLATRLAQARSADEALTGLIGSRCAPVLVRSVVSWANTTTDAEDPTALAQTLPEALAAGMTIAAVVEDAALTDAGALQLARAMGGGFVGTPLQQRVQRALANPETWAGASPESAAYRALGLRIAEMPPAAQLAYLEELRTGLAEHGGVLDAPIATAREALTPTVLAALQPAIAACDQTGAQDPTAIQDRPPTLEVRLQPGQGIVSGDSGRFGMCMQEHGGAVTVPGQDLLTRAVSVTLSFGE